VPDEFRAALDNGEFILSNETQQSALSSLEDNCEKVQTPMQRLEHGLLPWVNFFIMPVFALANAGVPFSSGNLAAALADRVTLGIILELVIGKTAGIFHFSIFKTRHCGRVGGASEQSRLARRLRRSDDRRYKPASQYRASHCS
jgi:hypothetical protein